MTTTDKPSRRVPAAIIGAAAAQMSRTRTGGKRCSMERRPIIAGREVAVKGETRVESQLFSFAQNVNGRRLEAAGREIDSSSLILNLFQGPQFRTGRVAVRANRLTLAARPSPVGPSKSEQIRPKRA